MAGPALNFITKPVGKGQICFPANLRFSVATAADCIFVSAAGALIGCAISVTAAGNSAVSPAALLLPVLRYVTCI